MIHAKGSSLVARESAASYEAAIDQLVDKLERQVEQPPRQADARVAPAPTERWPPGSSEDLAEIVPDESVA